MICGWEGVLCDFDAVTILSNIRCVGVVYAACFGCGETVLWECFGVHRLVSAAQLVRKVQQISPLVRSA